MKSLALGCILVLVLSGCGGGEKKKPDADTSIPPPGPAAAMVRGTLEMVGGPAPGKPQPVGGTVTITSASGSVTKATVDSTGKYAIGLFPGRYTIRGTSPQINDGKTTCTTEKKTITLVALKTVTADVVCSIP
ncbi:hypothetical protein [Nocardioides marmorisolisilvae]|uniref:hypothetical protein n=1 Tax=Nocardioides marmorisolisilvae TaxID=1542737 RepID=UPI0011CEA6DF|nr:hypothetical protein [Nocardioides marmorisolisilvae]